MGNARAAFPKSMRAIGGAIGAMAIRRALQITMFIADFEV
jgi:hypothetical protein